MTSHHCHDCFYSGFRAHLLLNLLKDIRFPRISTSFKNLNSPPRWNSGLLKTCLDVRKSYIFEKTLLWKTHVPPWWTIKIYSTLFCLDWQGSLSFSSRIKAITKSGFYHLKKIRNLMPQPNLEKRVHLYLATQITRGLHQMQWHHLYFLSRVTLEPASWIYCACFLNRLFLNMVKDSHFLSCFLIRDVLVYVFFLLLFNFTVFYFVGFLLTFCFDIFFSLATFC